MKTKHLCITAILLFLCLNTSLAQEKANQVPKKTNSPSFKNWFKDDFLLMLYAGTNTSRSFRNNLLMNNGYSLLLGMGVRVKKNFFLGLIGGKEHYNSLGLLSTTHYPLMASFGYFPKKSSKASIFLSMQGGYGIIDDRGIKKFEELKIMEGGIRLGNTVGFTLNLKRFASVFMGLTYKYQKAYYVRRGEIFLPSFFQEKINLKYHRIEIGGGIIF